MGYYWDDDGFYYKADSSKFVESGELQRVSSEYTLTSEDEQLGPQLNTLRNFPEGKRNCYTFRPKHGRNNKYLVRAFFRYGNYDHKDFIPVFEMHLGLNYWTTIDELSGSNDIVRTDIIHVALSDHIDVCLVNIGRGIPFISLLELYPLPFRLYHATYEASLLPLKLISRASLGVVEDSVFIRYSDDIYGRSWFTKATLDNSVPINTSSEAIDNDSTEYKLPKEVLSTAIQSLNPSFSLNISWDYDTHHEYYVYLHFFDFVEQSQYQKRIMKIAFTDTIQDSVALEYQQLQTKSSPIPKGVSLTTISITSSPGSSLPPMINAYEIYKVPRQPNSTTDPDDGKYT
ncbi:putative leucine-rich repeat receptor-like protein kinase At2g19210 [Neltuma alba]|uniref:putative leucine-rich repeat receptor-like protein kinase At2g19210 n=1 Tax=Neltuma alba TaxID=207710 RepID=UPI0010A588AB|nr:putative leucine-rich repeat receptor-like protein kinase At2g19210 [Prosopis alba]